MLRGMSDSSKKLARDLRVSKNTIRKVVRGDASSHTYECQLRRIKLDISDKGVFRIVEAQGRIWLTITIFWSRPEKVVMHAR